MISVGMDFVPVMIGAVIGLFMALNGFAEPLKGKDWRSSQRLKNLWLVVGGLLSNLLVDFRRFDFPAGYNLEATVLYIVSFVAIFLLAIGAVSFSFALSVRNENDKRDAADRLDYWQVLRAYLHHGRAQAEEMLGGLKKNAPFVTLDVRARLATAQFGVGLLIKAVSSLLVQPASQRHPADIDALRHEILKVAGSIVVALSADPKNIRINSSYMRYVPAEQVTDAQLMELHFAQAGSQPTGYLELCCGANHNLGARFVLQVHGSVADAERVLPGAPEAFLSGNGATSFDRNKIPFRTGVDTRIAEEIRIFFKKQPYESLACFKVDGSVARGVLNIESSISGFLGPASENRDIAQKALQPVIALLMQLE